MERLNANIGTLDGSLQKTPEVLHSIRVYVPLSVGFRVIEGVVTIVGSQPVINQMLIGHHAGTSADVATDVALQCGLVTVRDSHRSDLPRLSFKQSEDNSLTEVGTSAHLLAATNMHITSLAADESLVRLDFARHFVDSSVMHRVPDALEHEPCRCLSHLEIAANLVTTDTVFAVCQEPHRTEPFVQWDRGIFENRADFDSELLLAIEALPHQPGLEKRKPLAITGGACRPFVAPPRPGDNIEADSRVGKRLDCLNQTTGIFDVNRFHNPILPLGVR
jgi:hypothetical protein